MKSALILCGVFAFSALSSYSHAAPANGKGLPYFVKGTVATNRLGDGQCAFLRTAVHAKGSVGGHEQELSLDIVTSLANVLLDERTWVGQPGLYDAKTRSQPYKPTVTFTLSQDASPGTLPRIETAIDPVSQQMHTMSYGFPGTHGWEQFTSYALAAPQMNALLKRAFPQDVGIQALPVNPFAVPSADAAIPPDARVQIATLHTGMTRADLLKLFTTEGGLSNRFQRIYIYRGATVQQPIGTKTQAPIPVIQTYRVFTQYIKINAEFMPRTAHLQWIDGAGVLINPEELYRFDGLSEQPDDVIVRLSIPYLGFMVTD